MIRIEGFLVAAYPTEKVSKKLGERMLFGNKKSGRGLLMFGWGNGFSVFLNEEEAREAATSFSKRDGYERITPVKIRMKIPKNMAEIRKFKKGGSFVIIYAPLPKDRKILGPFTHNLSGVFEGRAGYFTGNGWKTFSSLKAVSKLAERLTERGFNVSLASLRLFDLSGEELTKPEEKEDMLEFLDLAEINS
jgi:hypothetical protein